MRLLTIEETSPTKTPLLFLEMVVMGQKLKAMVDSGAEGSFFSSAAAERLKLKQVKKEKADKVRFADGRSGQSASLVHPEYSLGEFRDREIFHVLDLPHYDVILGQGRLDCQGQSWEEA